MNAGRDGRVPRRCSNGERERIAGALASPARGRPADDGRRGRASGRRRRRHRLADLRARARRGARGGRAADARADRPRARAASTTAPTASASAAARRSALERLRARPWATLCIDDQRRGRPWLRACTAPQPDVRVGSATNGLAPVSVAERSLAAGPWQWLGLVAVVAAAVAADQLTKHLVTSSLALDQSSHVVGPLSIHRVENSGIAFGLFTSATAVVIALTGLAVVWMLVYFARSRRPPSGDPGGARAADRRQPLEPRRPRPARPRHRLHRLRLVARVQPRRQLHRHRRRRSWSRRCSAPTGGPSEARRHLDVAAR